MKKLFVYSGMIDEMSLIRLIKEFFSNEEVFYIISSVEKYVVEEGLPEKITEQGQVFSKKGEIRWSKECNSCNTIVVSENEIVNKYGLEEIEGKWKVEDLKIHLVRLDSPHVSPQFDRYPKDAEFLSAKICYKNGIATLISPRGFEK